MIRIGIKKKKNVKRMYFQIDVSDNIFIENEYIAGKYKIHFCIQ